MGGNIYNDQDLTGTGFSLTNLNESVPVIDKLNEVVTSEEVPETTETLGENIEKKEDMGTPMYN